MGSLQFPAFILDGYGYAQIILGALGISPGAAAVTTILIIGLTWIGLYSLLARGMLLFKERHFVVMYSYIVTNCMTLLLFLGYVALIYYFDRPLVSFTSEEKEQGTRPRREDYIRRLCN